MVLLRFHQDVIQYEVKLADSESVGSHFLASWLNYRLYYLVAYLRSEVVQQVLFDLDVDVVQLQLGLDLGLLLHLLSEQLGQPVYCL